MTIGLTVRRATIPVAMASLMLLTGPTVAGAHASAAKACSTKAVQPSIGGQLSQLNDVAVWNGCNAWAVGFSQATISSPPPPVSSFALHWNGRSWQRTRLTGLAWNRVSLFGVAFVAANRAWAVGVRTAQNGMTGPLILWWNGRSWRPVPSPVPPAAPSSASFSSVAAASASNAWAVGVYTGKFNDTEPLLMHWNGRVWTQVSSPIGGDTFMTDVTVAADGTFWATGDGPTNYADENTGLVMRYAHGSWQPLDSFVMPGLNLSAVASPSPTRTWVVGSYEKELTGANNTVELPLILEWNGTTWQQQALPVSLRNASADLSGVTAASGVSAWAAGSYSAGHVVKTLMLHWNGRHWRQIPSSNPGGLRSGDLSGITAVAGRSCTTIWAAGVYDTPPKIPGHAATFRC